MTDQTRFRIILAITMVIVLAGLLMWQWSRDRLINECLASGGHWDGTSSVCRPLPKIYLERGLKRT